MAHANGGRVGIKVWAVSAISALVLAACGGGGGGGAPAPVATTDPAVTPGGSCVAAAQQTPVAVDRVEAVARRATVASDSGIPKARQLVAPRALQVALGAVTAAKLATESTPSSLRGAPRKVGFTRDLPQATATGLALNWQTLADGQRAASVSITSPSAKGVRLGLLVRSLPANATLRVYAQSGSTAFEVPAADVLLALQKNAAAGATGNAARTYWTPVVEGAESTLEVALPAGADTALVDLAVPQLSHLFALPTDDGAASDAVTPKIGEAGSCEVDATCDASYQAESNSVAKMIFSDTGGTFQCTGTLLNDHLNSGTPYFVSANHCISTQAAASTLQTYWFYRAPSCGAGTLNPAARQLTGGATLLYASVNTDTSFMRLNTTPPAGAVYAGWSVAAPPLAVAVGSLHHPEGDLLKLSTGTVKSYQNCTLTTGPNGDLTCVSTAQPSSNFVDTLFTSGSTEEGSSGAALFQTIGSGRYVVGQLFGGSSSCSLRTGSNIYGRFDAAYNTSLKQWLAAPVVPNC
ncbi:MAG: hypothetical protein JWP29_1820 [Rhodoferax sp.]|nr:hypothetical protein [Rhodoferax sp.]